LAFIQPRNILYSTMNRDRQSYSNIWIENCTDNWNMACIKQKIKTRRAALHVFKSMCSHSRMAEGVSSIGRYTGRYSEREWGAMLLRLQFFPQGRWLIFLSFPHYSTLFFLFKGYRTRDATASVRRIIPTQETLKLHISIAEGLINIICRYTA
jgi:hypothetical protein